MKLNFCTECAASLTEKTKTVYICANGHSFFNNPHAAVAVILVNTIGEVLYSKRGQAPQKDMYDFPGGFADYGEDAFMAAKRELQEEGNVIIKNLKLISSVANTYNENVTTLDSILLCDTWTGELRAADDVAALEWKPLEFLLSDQFAWSTYVPLYEILKSHLQ